MTTVCLGVRVPSDMIEDLKIACKIVGAISYSDLIRDALRHYLAELSILSSRSEMVKAGKTRSRGDPENAEGHYHPDLDDHHGHGGGDDGFDDEATWPTTWSRANREAPYWGAGKGAM